MRVAWFHPFSGIAGDMALGSLIDAGADLDAVREILTSLEIPGWDLTSEDVMRAGIGGTKVHVQLSPSTVVRTAASIDALLASSALPERVRDRARLVFAALAAAEGHLHRTAPAQVHFHEVGSLDAIIDVVGTCAALEILDIDSVTSGPVTTGTGMVRAAHGIIPNPSPAVVELLVDAPTRGVDSPVELTTPTGAALLAGLVDSWGPMPAMTITGHGFGAGTRELYGRPNLCQVVIGDADDARLDSGQPVWLLETNLDDVTGEVVAHTVAGLLDAGAHDAWLTPAIMKKGRPGNILHVLADVANADALRRMIVTETGTLGVRGQRLDRWPESRIEGSVDSEIGAMRVKASANRAKAEYADAAELARSRNVALRDVQREIEDAWRANAQPADDHHHPHLHDTDVHSHHGSGRKEGPADPVA